MGKDHLLHVINRGYTEDYRRFYYADIQAVLVRETRTGKIINIILGILTATSMFFLALGYFVWGWESFALIPMAISAFLWLCIFLYSLLAGPTCVCHLRTAVQFEKLPSLYRIKTARKAIALLRHRVENVQGSFVAQSASS